MRSELPSVVDRFAAFAVAQVREGGKLFGRTFVRQGPLFSAAGWWLFQTSGAFGYGLRQQPAIMGKLLGVPGENAANYVQTTLSELASEQLRYAADKERTFLHLYLVPTLADYGVDFYLGTGLARKSTTSRLSLISYRSCFRKVLQWVFIFLKNFVPIGTKLSAGEMIANGLTCTRGALFTEENNKRSDLKTKRVWHWKQRSTGQKKELLCS